tara:strand:- start:8 stop:358 length:351 start_codon:yes stop_codon:yes gene_type:complete
MKNYWVYIITNKNQKVYYTGFTNDIERRILEHKASVGSRFSSQNNCTVLLYIDKYCAAHQAIQREKNIKNWKRSWKEDLIRSANPEFKDLALDWYSVEEIKGMQFEMFVDMVSSPA